MSMVGTKVWDAITYILLSGVVDNPFCFLSNHLTYIYEDQ